MKSKIFRFSFLTVIISLVMSLACVSCSDEPGGSDELQGIWQSVEYYGNFEYNTKINFAKGGKCQVKTWSSTQVEPEKYEDQGKWSVKGSTLKIVFDGEDGEIETYHFVISENTLTLYEIDEDGNVDYDDFTIFIRVN